VSVAELGLTPALPLTGAGALVPAPVRPASASSAAAPFQPLAAARVRPAITAALLPGCVREPTITAGCRYSAAEYGAAVVAVTQGMTEGGGLSAPPPGPAASGAFWGGAADRVGRLVLHVLWQRSCKPLHDFYTQRIAGTDGGRTGQGLPPMPPNMTRAVERHRATSEAAAGSVGGPLAADSRARLARLFAAEREGLDAQQQLLQECVGPDDPIGPALEAAAKSRDAVWSHPAMGAAAAAALVGTQAAPPDFMQQQHPRGRGGGAGRCRRGGDCPEAWRARFHQRPAVQVRAGPTPWWTRRRSGPTFSRAELRPLFAVAPEAVCETQVPLKCATARRRRRRPSARGQRPWRRWRRAAEEAARRKEAGRRRRPWGARGDGGGQGGGRRRAAAAAAAARRGSRRRVGALCERARQRGGPNVARRARGGGGRVRELLVQRPRGQRRVVAAQARGAAARAAGGSEDEEDEEDDGAGAAVAAAAAAAAEAPAPWHPTARRKTGSGSGDDDEEYVSACAPGDDEW